MNIFKSFTVTFVLYSVVGSTQMWNTEYQNKYGLTTETQSRSSSIPDDPLLFPNDTMPYYQYHLNIQANGFSIDYPATWQFARGHALVGMLDVDVYSLHPDVTDNYRNHLSHPFILTEEPATFNGTYGDHGSWVISVLSPGTNNNEGLAGVCQNCSIVVEPFSLGLTPYQNILSTGAQVINISAGSVAVIAPDCATRPALCNLLENEMAERDVMMVAISQNRHGNRFQDLNVDTFPGSHPNVIQVGGLDESLQFWDDCEGYDEQYTCGSRATQYQELVAPAKNILIAFTYTVDGENNCGFITNPPSPNYNVCSGNSFAAPQVTGLIGIIRSIYPQMRAADVRLLLQKTAQSPYAERHDKWGYGLINPLATVTEVLGKVATVQQTNRSIPVFAVRNPDHVLEDTAFSSSPQFIAAILSNSFRGGLALDQQPLNIGLALNNYQIPSSDLLPYAAFYILGTHNNPLEPGKELIKLYRMSKLDITGENPILDHAYVTSPYLEQFKTDGYEIDTIEGYIFPACEAADQSCQPPDHSECLFARSTATQDWAVMLQSQLTHEAYVDHTVKLNDASSDICLGYAYLPIDSDDDGLIDGYEAFLGTNINQADSDQDGRSDGEEMLEPVEAMFSDPLSNTNPFDINEGLTGTWYYPETSGQGLMLDVMKPIEGEDGRMFAAWFTYDLVPEENTAEFGSVNHRWFTAQGSYTGDKADLIIYLSENGRFDNPQTVESVAVGKMAIRFISCTSGVVSYSFDETHISGSFPITRLSPDQFCEDDGIAQLKSTIKSSNNFQSQGGLSGAWYNPQTSGQGFLFDVMESRDQMFAAWFSYSIEGNSPDVGFGSGDHRWFSAQGDWSDNGSEMAISLSKGGVFERQSSVTNKSVGTLRVTFDSCTSGSVEYELLDQDISGNFPIQRITPNVYCQE